MIDTLSREEYAHAQHFGTAGSVSHLDEQTIAAWRADIGGWNGKHWIFRVSDTGIWALYPLNVTTRTQPQAAEHS
ncbi:hypothetical protein GPX89_25685 [Nocardia sp. ET3-3]|uniref:Uncharacterized protein n=1 Tax=Nocardia terrae TaxID=2675851 RepID=A0A7K1V2G2_9NOCA|nr:hypothetical protein [Nocardia terrae]MVU80629.1 hypothetical protein [Nocardia terrae]